MRSAGGLKRPPTAASSSKKGPLYPALYRMEKRGWLDAEWGTSELGRRAKFYRLTRGRQQLASHTAAWAAFSAAVNAILSRRCQS